MENNNDLLTLGNFIEPLRYTPASSITHEKWLKAMFSLSGKLYGLHATIFNTGLRYVVAPPAAPTSFINMAVNDPEATLFNIRLGMYAKDTAKAASNDQKLFGQQRPKTYLKTRFKER